MKIATITIYDALNCGSYLQAYALQHAIAGMGHETAILDTRTYDLYKILRKWISRKNTIFHIKQRLKYRRDINKLNICKDESIHFDKVVIGSDEVWNINGHFDHGPQFFGDNINADGVLAYAPSIGFCSVEDFCKAPEAQKLKNFQVVFPRDENTQQVCREVLNQEQPRVCDPTLLIIDEWVNIAETFKAPKEKYVLYYSYLDNTPMKESIIRYAHSRGFKVVCANFNYKWADRVLSPSPLEFLSLIHNAECVFTSTFHGSVFSTIFKKQVIIRPSGPKVVDYLELCNLKDRIYTDEMSYDTFEQLVDQKIDYDFVFSVLKPLKEESLKRLSDAIKKE